jgi:hypothetical protein
MSEQSEEGKSEESGESKPKEKPQKQDTEPRIKQDIKEAQRIIRTFPYADYNEFLRHADSLRSSLTYLHGSGISGLSTPIKNFMPGSFVGQPTKIVTTNYDTVVERKILDHEDEVNRLKSEIVKIKQDSEAEFERGKTLITSC